MRIGTNTCQATSARFVRTVTGSPLSVGSNGGKGSGCGSPGGHPLIFRFSRAAGWGASGCLRLVPSRNGKPSASSPRRSPGPCAAFPGSSSLALTPPKHLFGIIPRFLRAPAAQTIGPTGLLREEKKAVRPTCLSARSQSCLKSRVRDLHTPRGDRRAGCLPAHTWPRRSSCAAWRGSGVVTGV